MLIDGLSILLLSHMKFFILQNLSHSFGVLLFEKVRGGFSRPRTLIAGKVGPNEDISLNVGRGHSLVDDGVC